MEYTNRKIRLFGSLNSYKHYRQLTIGFNANIKNSFSGL